MDIKYELYDILTQILSLKFKWCDFFLYARVNIWFERYLHVFSC